MVSWYRHGEELVNDTKIMIVLDERDLHYTYGKNNGMALNDFPLVYVVSETVEAPLDDPSL